jgi:hypothetical protein
VEEDSDHPSVTDVLTPYRTLTEYTVKSKLKRNKTSRWRTK